MFPTLSDIFEYLFHVHILLPVQTFGFFVALSFLLTYQVFVSEFKRKEADGTIKPFRSKMPPGSLPVINLLVNGLLGFVLGYKFISILVNYKTFSANPKNYIFSAQGSFAIGFLVSAAFIYWVYRDRNNDRLKYEKVKDQLVHPYQLMGLIVISAGFFGFIGAKLFDILENISVFWYNPVGALLYTNGLTYYGGLIFGALTFFYIGHKHGIKLVHLADIGSPGMMLAYGIGRIGCHLAGDGDWGIINTHTKPGWLNWMPGWMWSFKFPHNILNTGLPIKGCGGDHCFILQYGVYPTSFYEAVICILLFLLMWAFRKKICIPGLMFCIYLLLNGGERLMIEQIRVNPKYHLFNIAFTQAEFICLFMILGGIAGLAWLFVKNRKRTQCIKSTG